MATSLQVTWDTVKGKKVLSGTISTNESFMPKCVFVHENTGTSTLGKYLTVADTDELAKYPEWKGIAIPQGVSYIRASVFKIENIDVSSDVDSVLKPVVQGLSNLRQSILSTKTGSKVYTIS